MAKPAPFLFKEKKRLWTVIVHVSLWDAFRKIVQFGRKKEYHTPSVIKSIVHNGGEKLRDHVVYLTDLFV